MKRFNTGVAVWMGLFLGSAQADIVLKQVIRKPSQGPETLVETIGWSPITGHQPGDIVRETPWIIAEGPSDPSNGSADQELVYRETVTTDDAGATMIQSLVGRFDEMAFAQSEVRTIADQGPPQNRIDLTIVGDGYTLAEKEKFFNDAERIRKDLFGESTFKTYLPLFNVHAVFVPSNQSGLTDVRRVDTALGLYRTPKGSKRAILVGNAAAAERAIRLAPDTDYPILLANDDFYGGLGGRYAITTRSVESGKIVLRHELGHNFGEVGEEYDGGQVYSGANHSNQPFSGRGGWAAWANQQQTHDCEYLSGDYVWKPLDQGPYKGTFKFPSGAYRLAISLSSVGWETPNDVAVSLDGQRVGIEGTYTRDRSFFNVVIDRSITPGVHQLEVSQLRPGVGRVLAFANAYALPEGYDTRPDQISAFLTFDENGRARGYRPTHDSCLMRNMRLPKFCAVDIENMWLNFFKKIKLIDGVTVSSDSVTVQHPALNGLQLSWLKKNPQSGAFEPLAGVGSADRLPRSQLSQGTYRVQARFVTREIRRGSPTSTTDFTLTP